MKWIWFGWFGLIGLCLFLSFLALPNEINLVPYRLASSIMLLAMAASIICPVIASVRSTKWWLAVSICGLAATIRFFWIIAA